MAYSWTDVVASAGQQNFAFSIPYLSRDHIHVYINGAETSAWSFLMSQVVRLDVGAALNDTVRVRRITPIDEPVVDYSNGSLLGEAELDATALQSLYIAQEISDSSNNTLQVDDQLRWDALNRRIINLATPTLASDAATKAYVDDATGDVIVNSDAAQAAALAASASASSASTSASNASTSATAAAASASSASTSATNASTSETNALASKNAAATSETNALASKNAAATSETNAAASASSASTSATNAASSASSASTSASTASTQASNASTSASNAATSATNAATSETNAATSATNAAASAAKLSGTSTSSVAIGTGSKSFTTQSGKFFSAGTWLLISSDANPSVNYMHGVVTSYSGTSLTVNVTNIGGSGTKTDWTIQVSGTQGATGATGATGPTGPSVTDGDKGDITVSGSGAVWTIDNSAVTKAKIENVTASKLLGRGSASSGAPQEIGVSGLLSVSGTTLTAALASTTTIPVGGGSDITNLSGIINTSLNTVGTPANTTETDLQTFTMSANSFNKTGQVIKVKAWGVFGANVNNKTVKLYFGGTTILSSGALNSNGAHWMVEAQICRSGSNAQRLWARFNYNSTFIGPSNSNIAISDTGSIIIKVTGQNGSSSANDIQCYGMTIEFWN